MPATTPQDVAHALHNHLINLHLRDDGLPGQLDLYAPQQDDTDESVRAYRMGLGQSSDDGALYVTVSVSTFDPT